MDEDEWIKGRKGILPSEIADPTLASQYAAKVFDSVTEKNGRCPMMWVTTPDPDQKYNTKLSAFWRVIGKVVDKLGIANVDEPAWPSRLVWSNLYKVSPAEGGNPNSALCKIQLPGCLRLFQLEVTTYLPRRLLFVTGWDWAKDFLDDVKPKTPDGGYVEAIGQWTHSSSDVTKIVVVARPERKGKDKDQKFNNFPTSCAARDGPVVPFRENGVE